MSFPSLSAEDMAKLVTACEGDQDTLATIEAFCSSKTDVEVREVVEGRLVHAAGTAVFATGLARTICKLRSLGGKVGSHKTGRVLRALGLCVTKALQTDLAELRILALHRGLRQPALLLSLAEVVPDNSVGSDAQRASASALVAFCDRSPTLWKELAKLIRGEARLLKGFLGQASALASITDHRTQEIAFEAVYRMWKVWKKQPGGPPALPSVTPKEIKEGLSGISTTDFESQVRSMLATINVGDRDSDDDGYGGPPSSFPVETVYQVTDWTGLGCEQRLGHVKWLDVGGDSISIQVYSKSSWEEDGELSPGMFVSIPASVVAASSKIMVGTRSMQLDVPFLQCPALVRVTKKPPGNEVSNASCKLVFRLQGGAKTFNLFRKAIAVLISTVAKHGEEHQSSRTIKASVVSSNDVPGHPSGKDRRQPNKQLSPAIVRGIHGNEAKRARRPEETPTKATEPQGGNRRSATKRVRQPTQTPKTAADDQLVHKKSRPATEPVASPFDLTEEGDIGSANAMAAPPPKKNPSPAKTLSTTLRGSSNSTITPTVRAMFKGCETQRKTTRSIRSIAEGSSTAPLLGSGDDAVDDEDDENDSWMEPRRHLDLAPVIVGGKKDKSRAPKVKKEKETGRANKKVAASGCGSKKFSATQKDWEISDVEEQALSQSPQKVGAPELQTEKHGEEESAETPLASAEHRANAETVTRGYSFDMGRREDGGEDPVTVSNANRKRPAPGPGSATDEAQACRYRPQIDYVKGDSEDSGEPEDSGEIAEEVIPSNDSPDEEGSEDKTAPWMAGKSGFGNISAHNGEESDSGEDADRYGEADEEEGAANASGDGCVEEEEDSAMLAQLYNQLVMASQARDKRSKKRKTDARLDEAWEECGSYLESTSKAVVEHWRRQAGELLEEGRQVEEAVEAAKETVRAMNLLHESQWKASKERLKKHASVLDRLGSHIASGPGSSSNSLERQRKEEAAALQLELQEHRVGAVSRFAKTLTNFDKKKTKKAFSGGRGSSIANTSAILSHLKIRTT